jgi:hypothetical protein
LTNTLNLIQLAHQTAAAKGAAEQAGRLAPVADNLRELLTSESSPSRPQGATVGPGSVTGQADFQFLLQAAGRSSAAPSPAAAFLERSQAAAAMAEAGMNLTDIARQMGMTQDEVRLILDVSQISRSQQSRSVKEIDR